MFRNFFAGSWKTTVLGWLVVIGVLALQAHNLLDGDPTTVFDYKSITVALAGVGIILSRDNNVTSEAAHANAPPPGAKGLKHPEHY